jgi:aminoglycoside 3-N-acetyltransferase
MRNVRKGQVVALLNGLGLSAGDGVLVHSALQFLGRPEAGPETYYAALCELLGIPPEPAEPQQAVGTLAVPAFNFAFAEGNPFDPSTAPAQGMGVFSEYVRTRPGALRTPHPLQSLAVIGRHAAELAGRDTPSAFDPSSAFERLLELDFKVLLLGADIQAVSLLHYSEQRLGVPYRYWKDFSGLVRTGETWETRTYRMYVRDLQLDPQLKIYTIQDLLEARGQWRSAPLNYGQLVVFKARDFVAAADELLAHDRWIFVPTGNQPANRGST